MFVGPRTLCHWYIHRDILLLGIITLQTCLSKQLPVGLMVLSDGMAHFLKIEKKFNIIYQNYLVALILT